MRETLKIRHYVVGVIYNAGERSVQIMSSRDLAKYFNIARSTVSIALKELVDQGYLIPVKGKGYFTNPRKIMTPIPGKMPPLILLITIHRRGKASARSGKPLPMPVFTSASSPFPRPGRKNCSTRFAAPRRTG